MSYEIRSFTIEEERIVLEAISIDDLLFVEDLFQDIGEENLIRFEFSRKANNGAEMKYLYKICSHNKKSQQATSFGAKLQGLLGSIVYIPASFRVV